MKYNSYLYSRLKNKSGCATRSLMPSVKRYIVQPGYKTLKTEQINTTQATRTVQPPDTKTPKPTKWEKGNIFPNRMQTHQPLGSGLIAKLSSLRAWMLTSKIKIESSRAEMNTIQLSTLKYARDKRPRGCPGVHVRFLPTGKYLHSLSPPLKFSIWRFIHRSECADRTESCWE